MNIFNSISNQNINATVSYESITEETLQQNKNLTELEAGDVFKAEILDIKLTGLSIKLASGEILNAKTAVLPDSRIGEESYFKVRDNVKGQVILEMIRPTEDTAMEKMAKQVLENSNLFTNKENLELVKAMIKENLPLDTNSLEKALFFRYSDERMSQDKAIFLMKEEFPKTQDSVDKLLNHLDNNKMFSENLNELKNNIMKLDTNTQTDIFKVIENNANKFGLDFDKDEILDRLFLNTEDDNLEDSVKHFKFLEKTMEEFKNIANNIDNDKISDLTKDVKEHLDFMNQMKNYKEYIQLPIPLNDNSKQAELHVFKDGNKKKDLSKQASVLLALDYDTLGHLDIFINKNDRTLSVQFETDKDNTLNSLKMNINDLNKMLREKDFRLTNTTFLKAKEKHKFIDTNFHKNKEENPNNKSDKSDKKTPTKRFSFDMHV